jgi:hypothetical protein
MLPDNRANTSCPQLLAFANRCTRPHLLLRQLRVEGLDSSASADTYLHFQVYSGNSLHILCRNSAKSETLVTVLAQPST